MPTWSVDWQPVDGLFARVHLFTTDVEVAVVAAVAAEAMLLPAMLTRHEGRTDRPNGVTVWIPIIDKLVPTVNGGYRETDGRREYVHTTDSDILAIADAVRIGPNFDRPQTWPAVVA